MSAAQSTFAHPPASFVELQALATRLHRGVDAGNTRGEALPHLSPKALGLLESLLAKPETVGLSGISQLAEQQGVNPSSLTRLSKALGFSGFKAFQALFREDMAGSAFYSSRADRLLDFGETPGTGPDTTQDQALWQQEMNNLAAVIENLDDPLLSRSVAAIIQARHIHVIGLRASFGAAHYLSYYLDYLRGGVRLVSPQAGVDIESALHLNDQDLVIGIAFRPETRTCVDFCRLATEQGAELLALTNHPHSQLAGLTQSVLLAPAEGPFFFNPMSSLFMLVELLLARVAREMGSTAIAGIRRREALIARLNIE